MSVPPYPVAPKLRWAAVLMVLLAAGLTTFILLWVIWAHDLP